MSIQSEEVETAQFPEDQVPPGDSLPDGPEDGSQNILEDKVEEPIIDTQIILNNDTSSINDNFTQLDQLTENEVVSSMNFMNDFADIAIHDLDPYATLDDSQFTSTLTRLVESPAPIIHKDDFLFVNIESSEDDNEAKFEIFSQGNQLEDVEIQTNIPLLRPNSPTLIMGQKEIIEQPSETVPESPQVVEQVVPEVIQNKIDRAEYISKIKMNLIAKEKSKVKKQNLESKLVEYFKRKRVFKFVN